MQRLTIFGKGGIGKSTLSSNLAAVYALRGLRVLLVGCDPKHDTTVALTEGRPIPTVVERSAFMDSRGADASQLLVRGRLGIDCIEAGGPEPGIGCAGRGISRMIELMEAAGLLREDRYDVTLFDVLGDVVCGGFAAPLRKGFADKVVIVTSEELMSLYAANNIARAIRNYSANGAALCGLAANLRDPGADREEVGRFAARIGTEVLAFLERDPAVREAEYRRETVVERAPGSPTARTIEALAEALLSLDARQARPPSPLSDEAFHALSRHSFSGEAPPETAPTAAPTAPAPAPAAPRPPRPGPDLEQELSRRASLWEGSPGQNSQVWGASDQWRRFFCDFETRRHARTRLEVRSPTVHVWHQDLECSYATPDYFDETLPSYFKFPWPRSGEPEPPPRRGRRRKERPGGEVMTNLRDLDVIHGGGRKLDEAMKEAVSRAQDGAEAVVVHSTCVPTVIGDDAKAVVERWRSASKVPLLYTNPAETNEEVDVGLALFARMREDPAFAKVRRKGRSVNLVGFPEGPGLRELEGMLEEAGVSVNAKVLPFLDPETARRYLAAPVQVLYPNAAYEQTYRAAFETLPVETLRLEAPYGWAATKSWVDSVASVFGLKRRASLPVAPARAAAHGLAFVVDAPRIGRLTDARQTWGVPLLRVLRELGFRVQVLCFGPRQESRPGLSFFSTPEELEALLKEESWQAGYSEYAFDSRLARAGKAQFALDVFEMGFSGAQRSLDRLNGLCRWPFYRRYGRYIP